MRYSHYNRENNEVVELFAVRHNYYVIHDMNSDEALRATLQAALEGALNYVEDLDVTPIAPTVACCESGILVVEEKRTP